MGENFKLCLGCMSPKTEAGPCPFCGYSDTAPYLPSYLAPKTILNDRYLVGRLLSYNGEGANYLAYDKVTDKKVWIREYMPDTLCSRVKGTPVISVNKNNLAQYKTFMSEFTELNKMLTKMRTLNHINPALELFAENNTTYVVLEYIEGVTLKEYLQDKAGELSWEEVKKLFPPLFTTLSLVHNAGIIHRGIGLDTIYVTKNEELKLSGFCISAERTANTELASELFAGYAAPEQYSSSNWQGTWTDVYAISAVLYRILTGCMPIEAVSRIGNDNLIEPAQINPNVPSNVSKVIMSGLKLSGDMRVQTITELVTRMFEQPDYLEQGMNRTATIAIPKIKQNTETKKPVKKTNPKVSKIKTLIIIFVSTLVILGSAVFLTLYFLNGNEDNNSSMSLMGTGSETFGTDERGVSEGTSDETAAAITEAALNKVVNLDQSYEIPNFIGKNFELIQNSPTYKDWLVFVPALDYNEEHPKGEIYEQSISEGTFVKSGTTIELKVSKGSKFVSVPDYFGKTEKDYTAELDAAGIKYDKIMQSDEGFMDGYVMKTSKEPGEMLDVSQGEILVVFICQNNSGDSFKKVIVDD